MQEKVLYCSELDLLAVYSFDYCGIRTIEFGEIEEDMRLELSKYKDIFQLTSWSSLGDL